MSSFRIELTAPAQRLISRLQALPPEVLQAIAQGMDKANELAIARIQRDHLTGRGPFPPSEHKLGVRTNRLRSSVNASTSQVTGDKVVSAIGSNVIYAALHEFGGVVHHPARSAKVRLRLDARGHLVKQLANSHLARFASKKHKRVRETQVAVGAYDVDMPERAPIRTGLDESVGDYKSEISAQIIAAFRKN